MFAESVFKHTASVHSMRAANRENSLSLFKALTGKKVRESHSALERRCDRMCAIVQRSHCWRSDFELQRSEVNLKNSKPTSKCQWYQANNQRTRPLPPASRRIVCIIVRVSFNDF